MSVTYTHTLIVLGEYAYSVRCGVRAQAVSMSDWHDEIAPAPETVTPFGSPCNSGNGKRFLHHPYTGDLVELSGAASSRFWIEFECGKLLLPKIEDGLELLALPIVDTAREIFSEAFVQGCRWG